MGNTINFNYYYGAEAEQFSFIRIPRLLVKDSRYKVLSSDAKLLYGLMLDRMSLSMKNGWIDDENRVYIIYSVNSIMEDLGCGKEKAVKTLAELDSKKGIGLLERIRRGFGKPDIIYVKNFVLAPEEGGQPPEEEGQPDGSGTDHQELCGREKPDNFQRSEKPTSGDFGGELQEVGKTDLKKSEKPTSRSRENRPVEVGKTDPNYIEYNYIELNKINHINQSEEMERSDANDQPDRVRVTDNSKQSNVVYVPDRSLAICGSGKPKPEKQPGKPEPEEPDEVDAYIEQIGRNIDYDQWGKYVERRDWDWYEGLYDLICEVVCVERKTIKIAGENYPYGLVRAKFLRLNWEHLRYVTECMRNTATKITNIKSYLITALYNAPTTIDHYYQQEVQHDIYGGGFAERGII